MFGTIILFRNKVRILNSKVNEKYFIKFIFTANIVDFKRQITILTHTKEYVYNFVTIFIH